MRCMSQKIFFVLILNCLFLSGCNQTKVHIKNIIPDKSEDYKTAMPHPRLEVPKDIRKEPNTDYYCIP